VAARGDIPVAVDLDPEKLEIARRAGAAWTIDAATEDVSARLQALKPGGPDVVIEAIGTPATYLMAVDVVAFTGRIVYIGYSSEAVAYQTKKFVQKEIDIRGSRNSLPDDFTDATSILKSGSFPVDAMISQLVPLSEAGSALEQWSGQTGKIMRVVVDMGQAAVPAFS
jgi:threonine dehydrogenase-like Zn-dependent dehydrogenase